MTNGKYENPDIQVISIEPDESLMTGEGGSPGTSIGVETE